MPREGQSAIVTELYIGVSSVLIVKLRESETRVEQTAPSRSDEFLTIAERRTLSRWRNSVGILNAPPPSRAINFRNARRAPLYNNYNAQLRNKLAEIRREMGCGNLKM